MGGQPWYLTTLAAAEQLYRAVEQWRRFGEIAVTDLSLGFFRDVYDGVKVGMYRNGDEVYERILHAVMNYADGYLRVVVCLPFSTSPGPPSSLPSSHHMKKRLS